MTGRLSYAFLGILSGWLGYALAGLFTGPAAATVAGVALGAAGLTVLRDTVAVRGAMAVLEPIGIVLPILAIRHVLAGLGVEITPFSTVELLVFLLAYTAFLAASMGVIPVEAYRLGYAPIPVAVMVLAVCLYGALSGNWLLPLITVAGQGLWVAGIGSSNWFDHVLHATLVPVVGAVLLIRLF